MSLFEAPKPKVALIFNPNANKGRAIQQKPSITAELEKIFGRGNIHVFETKGPGHGIELAKKAIQDKCNLIIAAGGDGTINEAVNGMMSPEHMPQARLAIIPLGTGCDFGRHFGISEDTWLEVLKGGKSADVDVIEVQSTHDILEKDGKTVRERRMRRYCINEVSFGISGNIMRNINLKKKHFISKQVSYNMETLMHYLRLRNREICMQLGENLGQKGAENGHAKPRIINQALCAVSNGSFFGAGMRVCPSADPVSGNLGITIFENVGILDCVRILMAIRSPQGIGSHKKVIVRKAPELLAYPKNPDDKVYIEMDGEVFGRLPIHVKKHPRCLHFLLPAEYVAEIEKRGVTLHVNAQPYGETMSRVDSIPQYLVDVESKDERSGAGTPVFLEMDNGGVPPAYTNTTTVPNFEADAAQQENETEEDEVVCTSQEQQQPEPSILTLDSVRRVVESPASLPEAHEHQEEGTTPTTTATAAQDNTPAAEEVNDATPQEQSHPSAPFQEESFFNDAMDDSISSVPEESVSTEIPAPTHDESNDDVTRAPQQPVKEVKANGERTKQETTTVASESQETASTKEAPLVTPQGKSKNKPANSGVPSSGPTKECSECHEAKSAGSYSKTQWKKADGARKCKDCTQ